MDENHEITLTEAGWAWKVKNFTFFPFLAAQNLLQHKHSNTCHGLNFHQNLIFFLNARNARATIDKESCVITSTLFKMNSTCMHWCDLNFSCMSTSITSAEVSSCQNKPRYPNPIWQTVFTFRVFKLSFCEFMTMVSLHVHKST